MKTIINVKSQTKPIEIDDYTSGTTVFVRSNIKESTEIDPVFKTENIVYTYDETQYTYPEWNKLITDQIKQDGASIQQQVNTIQLAIDEIIKVIYPILEDDNKDKHTSVTSMYSQMINNKLIKIDEVPEVYKKDVLQYIENNKE